MSLSQHRGIHSFAGVARQVTPRVGLKKSPPCHEGDTVRLPRSIGWINKSLSRLDLFLDVSEAVIADILEKLDNCRDAKLGRRQLMTARLLEAALLCAGHYVDHCEFAAAGDLLFNPRQILVHRKGGLHPESKIRHGKLSEQMAGCCPSCETFPLWFRHNATLQISKPALITELLERIEQFHTFHSGYLDSIRERMKKAADAIVFLSAWHLSSAHDLYERMQSAPSESHSFISDNLCRFDDRDFIRMGLEIDLMAKYPGYQSQYLTA